MMRLPLLAVFALAAAQTPKPCKTDDECPKGPKDAVTHFCRVGVAASGAACDTKVSKTCAKLSVRGESCGGGGGAAHDCFRNKCAGKLKCRENGVKAELPGTCAKQCDLGGGKMVFEGWTGPAKDPAKWCQTRYCDGTGKTDIGVLTDSADPKKACPTDLASGLRCCAAKPTKGQVCCGETGAWVTPVDGKVTCAHVVADASAKPVAPFSVTCTDACIVKDKGGKTIAKHDDGWRGPSTEAGKWCNTCVCALAKLQCPDRECPKLKCCPPADKDAKADQVCCGVTGKWVTKDAKDNVVCGKVTKKYSAGLKVEPFHAPCTKTRSCKMFSNVPVTVAHTKKDFNPRPGQGCNECTCTDGTLACTTNKCEAPKCCDPATKPAKEAALCCGLTGMWAKVDGASKCGSHATQVTPAGGKAEPASGYPFFKACDAQCAVNTDAGGPNKKVELGWKGAKGKFLKGGKPAVPGWCDTCTCAVAAGAKAGTPPVVTCTTHAECPAVKCCPAPTPKGDYKCCGVTRRWELVVDGKVRCAGVSVSAKSVAAPLGVVCDAKKKCTLPGGAVLSDGQSGPDAGAEWCKRCRCADGKHTCTKNTCTKRCCALDKSKLPAGGTYRCCGADGQWVAKDGDDKYKCGGALVADGAAQLFADPEGAGKDAAKGICAKVAAADTKCTLHNKAKTEVAHGWTGPGLGSNWCHTCKCRAADLGKPVSCPKKPACPAQDKLQCCSAKPAKGQVCCGLTGEWVAPDAMCASVDLKLAALGAAAPVTAACKTCTLYDAVTVARGWIGSVPGDNWCNKCQCLANGKLKCTTKKCPALTCCRTADKPPKGESQCCGTTGKWATEVVKGKLTCAHHTIDATEKKVKKPFNTVACPMAKTCTIPGVTGPVHVGWIGKVACNYCFCQAENKHRCSTRVC